MHLYHSFNFFTIFPSDNHYYEKFEDGTINDITEEIPFNIPDSWEWIRLNNIVKIITGFSFKSSDLKENNKIRVIRISDFDETGLKNNKIVRIDPNIKFENYDIGDNSILMAMTGGTVGKSFLIEHIDEKMYLNQRVACINSYSNLINISYIYNVIQSSYVKGLINKNKNSTNDNISMDLINNFLIPLPCYNEQKNITNKILSINPIINNYNNKNKKLESLNKNYKEELKKSILQYAIQGKLVKQDPNDEPAEILINKILNEKRELIKTKQIKKENLSVIYKNPTDNQFYEKFDDGKIVNITEEIPFDIPDSWRWTRLNNIVSILGDGLHGTPTFSEKGEYYFINGNNLNNGSIIIKPDTKKVDVNEYNKYKKELNNNTMFISINGTVGNIAFYNNEQIILGKSACFFNLINEYLKKYLFYFFKTDYFIKYALINATGTTIRNVSLKVMRNTLIPIPSLVEQERIVKKLNHITNIIETAE